MVILQSVVPMTSFIQFALYIYSTSNQCMRMQQQSAGCIERLMDCESLAAGFGSRMLAKMGYEGQGSGLGRNQQGRAEPITATMRPKQLGLGAN